MTGTPQALGPRIRSRMGKLKDRLRLLSQTRLLPVEKLLMGGEQGIRPAKYAELSGDFFRPSTLFIDGAYCRFLEEYKRHGRELLSGATFRNTAFYQDALKCIELYGVFDNHPECDLPAIADRLIARYEELKKQKQAGKPSPQMEPVSVQPVKYSSHHSVIEGNYRAAAAIAAGFQHIPTLLSDADPLLTPLQQLLLDVQWTESKRELYQPVASPEIREQWTLVRKCSDRLGFMKAFLQQHNCLPAAGKNKSYLDLGSSYGWFVRQFGNLGFDAHGVERDPVAIEVSTKVYGISKDRIVWSDIIQHLKQETRTYDVVSLLSVLHHFVRGKNTATPEELIRSVDKITGRVLFLDTGQEHEPAFKGKLKGWTPEFIEGWLRQNTSFSKVIPLGIDGDAVPPYHSYYGRTLFACIREG